MAIGHNMEKPSDGKQKPFLKPVGRWTVGLTVALALAIGGIALSKVFQVTALSSTNKIPTPTPLPDPAVSALGRLEPEGEVIQLSAANSLDGSRVLTLNVKEGDRVRQGDVVAVLDSLASKKAALEQAKQQVKVAESRLEQVKAGAKSGEIIAQQATIARLQAQLHGDRKTQISTITRLESQLQGEISTQQATIDRLEAEVNNAQVEAQRYEQLSADGATSDSIRDTKRLTWETSVKQLAEAKANLKKTVDTLQEQINEAKATLQRSVDTGLEQISEAKANLNRIAEVRPVDLQAAQADVDSAIASVEKANADLDLAYIKSPINGQILKINTRPGEKVNDKGIADIGQTNQMYAVAEIYESDIKKICLNQPALITSDAIKQELSETENPPQSLELHGKVAQIGLQIGKKDILDTDPAADIDARVVEVKIRLNPEDSQKVAGLTNLKIEVKINTSKCEQS